MFVRVDKYLLRNSKSVCLAIAVSSSIFLQVGDVRSQTGEGCIDFQLACLQAQTSSETLQPQSSPVSEELNGGRPASITISRFQFDGNTAFSDRELSEKLAGYLNRPLTFVELLDIEKELERIYTQEGYLNSGGVIEANQALDPTDAVVVVRVVEGALEAIEISGNEWLRDIYIRSRLEAETRGALNQDRIVEALQLLQLDPLIESVSAELSAGSQPQSSVLLVRIEEANPIGASCFC